MSDLASELRQVADDAACHAMPLPAADVIRRGDRRRHRTIVQRSLGGLSAVGAATVAGVMIFAGAPAANPAAAGSAGTAPGTIKVTGTASAGAGNITLNTAYRITRRGKVRVLSVTYSGHVNARISRAELELIFQPPANHPRLAGYVAIILVQHFDHGNFAGSLQVGSGKHQLTLAGDSVMVARLAKAPPKAKTAKAANHKAHLLLQSGIVFAAASG